jgi:hypothetical protein
MLWAEPAGLRDKAAKAQSRKTVLLFPLSLCASAAAALARSGAPRVPLSLYYILDFMRLGN